MNGERLSIRQLRGLRLMTQIDLSEATGISARTIGSYEDDVNKLRKASYETIETLAQALGVTVDDIFLDQTSEKPNKNGGKDERINQSANQ